MNKLRDQEEMQKVTTDLLTENIEEIPNLNRFYTSSTLTSLHKTRKSRWESEK